MADPVTHFSDQSLYLTALEQLVEYWESPFDFDPEPDIRKIVKVNIGTAIDGLQKFHNRMCDEYRAERAFEQLGYQLQNAFEKDETKY